MFSFVLNLPYTCIGILVALFLRPLRVSWNKEGYSIIFNVRKNRLPFNCLKGWRGITIGHSIILNSTVEKKDLEHELIHIGQYVKFPFIFPLLYWIELIRKGYRDNKYEVEAYTKSGNRFNEALNKPGFKLQ